MGSRETTPTKKKRTGMCVVNDLMIFYHEKRLNSVLGDISPAESGRVGGACQLKPAPVQASPFLFFCLLGLHVDLAF